MNFIINNINFENVFLFRKNIREKFIQLAVIRFMKTERQLERSGFTNYSLENFKCDNLEI